MQDWKKTAIKIDSTISEAFSVLKKTGTNIVLIVDDQDHLLGVVTDSDIRSGLLRGVTIDQSVNQIYNTSPITAHKNDDLSY